MWNFERKKRTHLPHIFPQKVKPSSFFSLAPDLPWNQLPRFNPFKGRPRFLHFIKEGYTKIVRSQAQDENQENQDTVLLSTQHSALTYTVCLSVFKVMTVSISLKYKSKISITIDPKYPKEYSNDYLFPTDEH